MPRQPAKRQSHKLVRVSSARRRCALDIAEAAGALYLNLESKASRQRLTDPALFLGEFKDRLVVLAEIHCTPELFPKLRAITDTGRRNGKRAGRYPILGSALTQLLRKSGKIFAGWIEFVPMLPLDVLEEKADVASQTDRALGARGLSG